MGSPAPQGAEFQVFSVVIRTNFSSDGREEAEMKGEEQHRLSHKLGMGRKENRVFSSPRFVPMERSALAEWQKKAEGSQQYFSHQHVHEAAITSRQPSQDNSIHRIKPYQAEIKGNRLLLPQPPINHQSMQSCVI